MSQQTRRKLNEKRRQLQKLKQRKGEWPQIRDEVEALKLQAGMLNFELEEESKIRLEDYPSEALELKQKVHQHEMEEMKRLNRFKHTPQTKRALQAYENKLVGEWQHAKVQEKLASGELTYPTFETLVEEDSPRESVRPLENRVRDDPGDWEAKSMISESSRHSTHSMEDPELQRRRRAGELNRLKNKLIDVEKDKANILLYLRNSELALADFQGSERDRLLMVNGIQELRESLEGKEALIESISSSIALLSSSAFGSVPSSESKAVQPQVEEIKQEAPTRNERRREQDEIVVDTREDDVSDEEVLRNFRAKARAESKAIEPEKKAIEIIDLVDSDEDEPRRAVPTGDETEDEEQKDGEEEEEQEEGDEQEEQEEGDEQEEQEEEDEQEEQEEEDEQEEQEEEQEEEEQEEGDEEEEPFDENGTCRDEFLRVQRITLRLLNLPKKTYKQMVRLGEKMREMPKVKLCAIREEQGKLRAKYSRRMKDKNPKKIARLIPKLKTAIEQDQEYLDWLQQWKDMYREHILNLSTAPTEETLEKVDTMDAIIAQWDRLRSSVESNILDYQDRVDTLQGLLNPVPQKDIPTMIIDEEEEEEKEAKQEQEELEYADQGDTNDDAKMEEEEEVKEVPMAQVIDEEWLREEKEEDDEWEETSLETIERDLEDAPAKRLTAKAATRRLLRSLRQQGVKGVSSQQAKRMIVQVLKVFVAGPSGDLIYDSLNNMHGVQPVIRPSDYDPTVTRPTDVTKECWYDDVYAVHAALQEFGDVQVSLKGCLVKCAASPDSSSRVLVYLLERGSNVVDDDLRRILINRWIHGFSRITDDLLVLKQLLSRNNMWWNKNTAPSITKDNDVVQIRPRQKLHLPHPSFYRSVDYSQWKPKEVPGQEPPLPVCANLELQRVSNQVSKMYVLIRSSISVFVNHMRYLQSQADKKDAEKVRVDTLQITTKQQTIPGKMELDAALIRNVFDFANQSGIQFYYVRELG